MSNILHSDLRSVTSPMLFSAMSVELQEALVKRSSVKEFSEGQIIQQRGERANGFYLIESGSVTVGRFFKSGEFRGVAVLGPGDSWGELAMFSERLRVVDAIARSDCTIRFVRAQDFDMAIANRPMEFRALLAALSKQLQDTLDIMSGIRLGSAHNRVAGLLTTIAEPSMKPARIRITQQELGELLGLTRATVSGVLKELERAGVLTRRYGFVEIHNLEKLQIAALDHPIAPSI